MMTRTPSNLIDALKRELEEKTFAQISKETGIGVASLHGYSNGTSSVAAQNMEKLAEYFDVDITYLRGESIYKHLGAENRLEIAKRLHKDVKAKEIFEMFASERMAQIADGDKSNKSHVAYTRRMAELKAEQQAERESQFQALDEAFQKIPAELKKEAVLWLSERI